MREIRTDRLILRAFRETDCDDLFEYLSQLDLYADDIDVLEIVFFSIE